MSFPENPYRKPRTEAAQPEERKALPPWHTCAVGESWVVEDYFDRNPYLAASTHGRRFGKKFSSRREGNSMRITRIA